MEKELSAAAREARRAYHRKYRETHKEQIKENERRYWERKAAAALEEQEGTDPEQEETDEQKEND